jgi:hypothetical protein
VAVLVIALLLSAWFIRTTSWRPSAGIESDTTHDLGEVR